MQDWHKLKPGLFGKQPYHLPGCDLPKILPGHIGWTLHRAAQVWRAEITAAMAAAGYGWFGQARANPLPHIRPGGLRQGELIKRARLTKQAVKFVDELVADGTLMREPDKNDARARRVLLTKAGLAAMGDADRIKAKIEGRWRACHEGADFDRLDALLHRVVDLPPERG